MWNLPSSLQTLPVGQFWLPRGLLNLTFLGVVAAALVVTLLLYTMRPEITRRTVIALLPWMLISAALPLLASSVDYPEVIRPAVTGFGAYLTVYTLMGVVWFATIQFARSGQPGDRLPTYLGSTGAGAATMVMLVLFLQAGTLSRTQLFWLAIAPITAVIVAGVVLLLVGLWYPEAAAYTGMVGGFVIFGHALAAIATTVVVISGGPHSTLSLAILNGLTAIGAAGIVGIDTRILWAGGFIWVRLILATAAITALAMYTRRQPNRGNLVLGFVAAIGVIGGSATLLSLVVGG